MVPSVDKPSTSMLGSNARQNDYRTCRLRCLVKNLPLALSRRMPQLFPACRWRSTRPPAKPAPRALEGTHGAETAATTLLAERFSTVSKKEQVDPDLSYVGRAFFRKLQQS